MRDGAKVHDLLRVGLGQHCIACLTAGVHVGMVAKDIKRMRGDTARGDVDDVGQQLARDFIHIRDHQQKSLRCGVSRCQSAGCK